MDYTPITVALIAALPGLLAALVAAYAAWIGRDNKRSLEVIHVAIDGRMDELLAISKANSHQDGVEQGRAEKPAKEEPRKAEPDPINEYLKSCGQYLPTKAEK